MTGEVEKILHSSKSEFLLHLISMIDAGRCFEGVPLEAHPMTKILKVRISYEKRIETMGEAQRRFVRIMPLVEENKISQFVNTLKKTHSLSATAGKFGYNFVFDAEWLRVLETKPKPEWVGPALVYFLALAYSSQKSVDLSLFVRMLRALQLISGDKRKDVFSFAFALVLEIMNGDALKGADMAFAEILNILKGTQYLVPEIFPVIVEVCNVIGTQGSPEIHSRLQDTIETMLQNNCSCLRGHDISQLMEGLLISLNVLDIGSLNVLSSVMGRCGIETTEQYLKLICHRLKFFTEQLFKNEQIDLTRSYPNEVVYCANLVPEIDYVFHSSIEMEPPLFDQLTSSMTLKEFFGMELHQKIMSFVHFGSNLPINLRERFLSCYQQELWNSDDTILVYVTTLALIAEGVMDPSFTNTVVGMILPTQVFNETHTIFRPDSMNAGINFVRKIVLEAVAKSDPDSISQIIAMSVIYPVLLTENLLRVLLTFSAYDPAIFVQDPTRTILGQTLLNLLRLNSDIGESVRSSYLEFVFTLVRQPAAAYGVLTSDTLLQAYFSLVFERNLTDIALECLRVCIANAKPPPGAGCLELASEFFANLVVHCRQNISNDEYRDLLVKAVNTLVTGLEYNPRVAWPCIVVLDEILNCFPEWQDEKLVMGALSLLGFLFIANPSFGWNKERFSKFYQGIIQTFPDNLPQYVLSKLWCICGNTSFVERKESLLVRNPMMLPLTFAVCANYSIFSEMINVWVGMCKYSFNNKISFHKGLIDNFLLQYLADEAVEYKCVPIAINTPQSECRTSAFRLLNQIISEETNFEVAYRFCSLLALTERDECIYKFFNKVVSAGTSLDSQQPIVPLDSCYPIVEVPNLPWDTIKNHFTFDIVGKFDDVASFKMDSRISIMTMTDKVTSLVFHLHNSIISATLTPPNDPPITVHLFKNVDVSDWARMTVAISKISRDPPQYRIVNFFNRERLSETVLKSDIVFNTADLKFTIGGSDQSPESHPTFFKFKAYRLYPFVPKEEEFLEIERNSEDVTKRAVFSAGQDTDIRLPFFHTTENILRYLCEGRLADRMADMTSKQMLPLTIDLLAYVFRRKPYAQVEFFSVDVLLRKMMNAPEILNYSLYYSVYCALGSIQYMELRLAWFERLVMNVWLWVQCDQTSFHKILCHWQSNLTNRHSDLFQNKCYFSVLLTQFYIMFCLEKDRVPGFFQKSCSRKLSQSCGEALLKTMSRVAKLNFNANDFDVLFSFAMTTQNPMYISNFLITLKMMSRNQIVKQKMTGEHFALLHKLLRHPDKKLLRLAIVCLHNLSNNDIFEQLISAAFEVLSYPFIDKLFAELLTQVKMMPTLLPWLATVALHLGESYVRNLAHEMAKVAAPSYKKLIEQENWHIFFVLIAVNLHPEDMSTFCLLFANCLVMCGKALVLENSLAVTLRLSMLKTAESNPVPHLVKHLSGIVKDDNKPFLKTLAYFCYYCLFMHLENQFHSPGLVAAFKNSPYKLDIIEDAEKRNEYMSIAALETLLDEHLFDFQVHCHLYLNEEGLLADEYLGRIGLSLVNAIKSSNTENPLMEQHFTYFTNRSTMHLSQRTSVAQHLTEILEMSKTDFQRLMVRNLENFKNCFRGILVASRQLVSDFEKSAEARNLGDVMLRHVATEMRRWERVEHGQLWVPEMKRRNLCSVVFLPTRRKRFSRRIGDVVDIQSSVEIPCAMVTLNRKRDYTMKMDGRQFLFVPHDHTGKIKSIGFARVRMLLARPHMNAFEFFLTTGHVYLIEFEQKDLPSVVQRFQGIKYKSAECIHFGGNKIKIEDSMKRWTNRELSNFEYIMKLNISAGYSFRNEHFYPLAPPVLIDIEDDKTTRSSYRGTVYEPVDIDVKPGELGKAFVRTNTILPDLYCDPLVLETDTRLPKWSASRYEFVYRARKLLESPNISLILNQWIDRVFGPKSRQQPQFVLFNKAHPARNVVEQLQFKEFECNLNMTVKHSVCLENSREKMVLAFVHKNNRIQTMTLTWTNETTKSAKKLLGQFKSEADDLYFDQESHQLAAYSQSQGKLFLVNDALAIQEIPFYARSMIFASFSGTFLFSTDKCTLSFCTFAGGNARIRQLCFVKSEITGLAVNQKLQICALATIDEMMHIYDVKTGECLGAHHTKKEILQILITHYWGFVVAITRDEIFVYSQNGELIKSERLPDPIDKAFTFTLTSGFDFLAYHRKGQEIVVFEAFYPANQLVVFKFPHEVTNIFYDPFRSNFVVVSRNGLIKLVPYNLTNYVC